MDNQAFNLFVIKDQNFLYKRALIREINVWRSNNNEADLDATVFLSQEISYKGKTIKISKNRDWLDFIGILGNFNKGLILGGGNSKFETYLLNKGIVKTFENYDIVFKKSNENIKSNLFADLNFVTLKENTYDIIIAKSVLHHIINLEHLLFQVNKALKQDGIFVVLEYIGENKQQWRDDKIRFINDILEKFGIKISRGTYDNFVPFESIRSEEIPEIIDQIFSESKIVEKKWDYIFTPAKLGLYHYQLRYNINQKNTFSADVLETLKSYEIKAKEINLLPTILFGVYKKNMNNFPIVNIKYWDKNKIKKELELNFCNLKYSLFRKIKIIIKDYYNYIIFQLCSLFE